MKITKTEGYMDEDASRKGYVIHTECGASFTLSPREKGQGFEHDGKVWKTKKAFKDFVEEGGLEPTGEGVPMLDGVDTWDCVHPCALLISYWLKGHPGYLYPEVKATLDSYGWLDESGQPDFDRADKEIERVNRIMRLKNGN